MRLTICIYIICCHGTTRVDRYLILFCCTAFCYFVVSLEYLSHLRWSRVMGEDYGRGLIDFLRFFVCR